MRVFFATFPGVWLGGHAVVVAADEDAAESLVRDKMRGALLAGDITLVEIDTSSEDVPEFYNGDY